MAILAGVLALAACRGGSGGTAGGETRYTVGGALTGLTAVQSVVLRNNGDDPLTRSANGSFTFASPLANGAPYRVTVFTPLAGQTCRVTNGSGSIEAADVSSVVVACSTVVPPATWTGAARISDARSSLDYELYANAVDVDEKGTAVALWVEETKSSGTEQLWSSTFRAGGWGAPVAVAGSGSRDGNVAMLPGGDALVVYAQQDYHAYNLAISQRIFARRFDAKRGAWGTPTKISVDFPNDLWPSTPSVAADPAGNAFAVWAHDGQVWARRYLADGGWSSGATQLSESPRSVTSPKIFVDANGIFTTAWIEDSSAYTPALPGGGPNRATVFARRFDGEWGVRQRIGRSTADLPGDFDSASRLSLDGNAGGSLVAVWEQTRTLADGRSEKSIDAARFDRSHERWLGPETIVAQGGNLSWPRVALANDERALAIWTRAGNGATSVRGAWYDPARGNWGAPERLDQTGTGNVHDAVLAMDADGNVELAWNEAGKGLVERRFDARSRQWGDWNVRPPVGADLQLAVSRAGHAVLIGDYLNLNPLPWTREISAWVYAP